MKRRTVIKLVKELLNLKDMDKICKHLPLYGFRHTNTYCVPEFDCTILFKRCKSKEIFCKDLPNKQKFHADVYTKVKGYKGITFISIFKSLFFKGYDCYLPCQAEFFTDAPVNEEFEKNQASLVACDKCREVCVKKDMHQDGTGWFCQECYFSILEEKSRQYENEHPEEFEFLK